MIIADRKPIPEILDMVKGYKKVLLLGCKGCVTVCNIGGAKEVGILASIIKIARKREENPIEIHEKTLERQCDPEYVDMVKDIIGDYEAVLTMACGVGPQFLSERYPGTRVYPAVNTTSFGGAVRHGVWEERCAGCGACVVHYYDGLCPVARCSKSLLNGPCGGSSNGKCEVSKDTECIWDTIVMKKIKQGRLNDLLNNRPAKDWRTAKDGGPRRSIREDIAI
jgi:ferredoxin